jgi:hypothetical protein
MIDRQLRLRKQMPFYLSTGLIIGLSREKSVASRPKSRIWWTEIVKKSFNDQQWIENFRIKCVACEKGEFCQYSSGSRP